MFGENPIAPNENQESGMTLHLVGEGPFSTVQGEGPYAGHRATFIRLHGCNLRCTFCDTEFSSPKDRQWHLQDIIRNVRNKEATLVVITGGEPLRQNILPLCANLVMTGYRVQIETAGTLWIEGLEKWAEIVASPKTPVIHPKIYMHAVAFKYIVDCRQLFETFIPVTATQPRTPPRTLARPRPGAPVYVSPMDTYDEDRNKHNRKLVGQLAKQFGVIAGLQLHKFMELE